MFTLDLDLEAMIEQPGKSVGDTYRPLKVLIIDDNVDFVKFFKMIITHLGYEVYTAYDGKSGIEFAKYVQPDMIFCDINLPDITGFEVAEKIKQGLSATIIALSGSLIDTEDAPFFDSVVSKPIRTSLLKAILQNSAHRVVSGSSQVQTGSEQSADFVKLYSSYRTKIS